MGKKTLLIVTNVDWFLISHRLVLAKAAKTAGWNVFVACEDTGRAIEIINEGVQYVDFRFSRSGTNIFKEMQLIFRFRNLFRLIKPDVVHQITIKPVVYGGIAAKLASVPGVVNAISGLGYMFAQGKVGYLQKFIMFLIKFGTKRDGVSFIFQNEDDRRVLKENNAICKRNKTYLIKGSGVDLETYSYIPMPEFDVINILMPCRMLWDKGIRELREATDILKDRYKGKIKFTLVGMVDNDNKSGVSKAYLHDWEDDGYVEWKGHQTNMVEFYSKCHIVVLPSYREGLPKTLIEACAIGRPIVTTDAIGCKDCVDEGINGIKVPIKDSGLLAKAIERLVGDKTLMEKMGKNGRIKAEQEFSLRSVIDRHLEIYESLRIK